MDTWLKAGLFRILPVVRRNVRVGGVLARASSRRESSLTSQLHTPTPTRLQNRGEGIGPEALLLII
jgi:hypothetical protein